MDEPALVAFLETVFLPAPPSCILSTSLGYVVGTYTLHKHNEGTSDADDENATASSASRSGSLCIVRGCSDDGRSDFKILGEFATGSAVLDMIERTDRGHLGFIAVANSTGGIEVWREDRTLSTADLPKLRKEKTVQAFSDDLLVLKLSAHPSDERKSVVAASLSDGSIAVVDLNVETKPVLWTRQLHELEPWEVCWVPSKESGLVESNVLMSGGDDSCLHVTQLPEGIFDGTGELQAEVSVGSDTRTHNAGVTAILPLRSHLHREALTSGNVGEIVLTGSYDDRIRILRARPGRRWESLAETNLEGGVWRLLPLPESSRLPSRTASDRKVAARMHVLASCMYAGARVVEVIMYADGAWDVHVLAKFTEHESMNYASAADVPGHGPSKAKDGSPLFITTSFYDKRFCVWQVQ